MSNVKIKNVSDYWVGLSKTIFVRKTKRKEKHIEGKISTTKTNLRGIPLLIEDLNNFMQTYLNERIYDLEFGNSLPLLLFSNNKDEAFIKDFIKDFLKTYFEKYDGRLFLTNFEITPLTEESYKIIIVLQETWLQDTSTENLIDLGLKIDFENNQVQIT